MIISVVVLEHRESPALLEAAKQLKELGVDYEVFTAKSWPEGFSKAKGEFVCFLEPDSSFSPDYFDQNLAILTEKENYRKLAMVASAVKRGGDTMYGLVKDGRTIKPSYEKSSSAPYGVQVGFLPGAIIRRSALSKVKLQAQNPLSDSFQVSMAFWLSGFRCLINPQVLYETNDSWVPVALNLTDTSQEQIKPATIIFKREMIG